jgi:transcriptional regulator with GAF, ATPase, and Fis domain
MRRLSIKQNFLLDQLRDQGKRIEKLSRLEHDLIKEVHPQVNEIKEGMEEMMAVVKENAKTPAITDALPAEAGSARNRKWLGHVARLRRILRGKASVRMNRPDSEMPRRKA